MVGDGGELGRRGRLPRLAGRLQRELADLLLQLGPIEASERWRFWMSHSTLCSTRSLVASRSRPVSRRLIPDPGSYLVGWALYMTGSGVQEIVAGIWRWERRPRGLHAGEFGVRTSYAVVVDGETLLVDPLVDGDEDPALGALDDLVDDRVRILVSMPFHTRSAEPLWRRYRGAKARIYGHPDVATRLGDASGFEAVTGGGGVDGVARFHPIGSPPRSEQPIEIPAHRALVFGDAVVETGGGELRVWDSPLDSERRRRWWNERYLPTLDRLAALEVEHVLVTHGQAVVGGGAAALRRALDRDPWQCVKR